MLAYFTTDVLRLRLMTMVAAACLAAYFASRADPLWNVVGWNLFFLALNLFQLMRIVLVRRAGARAS